MLRFTVAISAVHTELTIWIEGLREMGPGRRFECKWDEGETRDSHNLPSKTNIVLVANQEG
jgi:hypothetical protein